MTPTVEQIEYVMAQHNLSDHDWDGLGTKMQHALLAHAEMKAVLEAVLTSEEVTLGDGGSILGDNYRQWIEDALALADGKERI